MVTVYLKAKDAETRKIDPWTVNITVEAVDDQPLLAAPSLLTVREGSSVKVGVHVADVDALTAPETYSVTLLAQNTAKQILRRRPNTQ